MRVIADVSITPLGVGASVREYVKAAHKVFEKAGLNASLCPNSTVIEGEYDDVFATMKRAMEAVFAKGAPRVTVTVRMDSRTDKEQTAQNKIDAILGG